MSGLILPDVVRYRHELEAQLEAVERKRVRAGWLQHFDAELKQLDPYLSLVKAQESHDGSAGLKAGYWHVKRDNPFGLPSFVVIEGPDGEFVEPHAGVLEMLKRNDTQRPGWFQDLKDRQAEDERKRARAKENWREQMNEEFASRLKAYDNPGVRFGGKGWTNRAGARKG